MNQGDQIGLMKRIKKGVRHTVFSLKFAVLLSLFLSAGLLGNHWSSESGKDYSRLIEFIELEDKEAPLYAFDDFEDEFDENSHWANVEYLNDHPGLIRRIKADLDGGKIRWRLDHLTRRLLFVPEKREEYAALFESYCYDVIDYVLEKTNLDDPYRDIQTLMWERPQIPDQNGKVTAFVVHNLAHEYMATYVFSNEKRKKVKIRLNGTVFSGEVGSYGTNIYLRGDGKFEFVRDNYTIWQNSAKNSYTALMTPVEETLHIALRAYTERAIKEEVVRDSVQSLEEVERIAQDWMAIEEAIVGGLVSALLPEFLGKHLNNLSEALIEQDKELKSALEKYRHLEKGMEIIERMGHQEAVEMYKNNPLAFEALLS